MKDDNHRTVPAPIETARRGFLRQGLTLAAGAAVMSAAPRVWAAGSDKPEKEEVKIGFIPLTDCASVVMASVLGIDKKYGIRIVPTKEASWAGVRANRLPAKPNALTGMPSISACVRGVSSIQRRVATRL